MGINNRNGVWYAEFFDTTRTPNMRRYSLRTKNKGEARRKYVELEQDWQDGTFDPWTQTPVATSRRARKRGSRRHSARNVGGGGASVPRSEACSGQV